MLFFIAAAMRHASATRMRRLRVDLRCTRRFVRRGLVGRLLDVICVHLLLMHPLKRLRLRRVLTIHRFLFGLPIALRRLPMLMLLILHLRAMLAIDRLLAVRSRAAACVSSAER